MDKFLLQFDALKFFLSVHLQGESLPKFNFFNVNPQTFRQNRNVHLSNCLERNFSTFVTLVSEILDVGIIAKAKFLDETFFS